MKNQRSAKRGRGSNKGNRGGGRGAGGGRGDGRQNANDGEDTSTPPPAGLGRGVFNRALQDATGRGSSSRSGPATSSPQQPGQQRRGTGMPPGGSEQSRQQDRKKGQPQQRRGEETGGGAKRPREVGSSDNKVTEKGRKQQRTEGDVAHPERQEDAGAMADASPIRSVSGPNSRGRRTASPIRSSARLSKSPVRPSRLSGVTPVPDVEDAPPSAPRRIIPTQSQSSATAPPPPLSREVNAAQPQSLTPINLRSVPSSTSSQIIPTVIRSISAPVNKPAAPYNVPSRRTTTTQIRPPARPIGIIGSGQPSSAPPAAVIELPTPAVPVSITATSIPATEEEVPLASVLRAPPASERSPVVIEAEPQDTQVLSGAEDGEVTMMDSVHPPASTPLPAAEAQAKIADTMVIEPDEDGGHIEFKAGAPHVSFQFGISSPLGASKVAEPASQPMYALLPRESSSIAPPVVITTAPPVAEAKELPPSTANTNSTPDSSTAIAPPPSAESKADTAVEMSMDPPPAPVPDPQPIDPKPNKAPPTFGAHGKAWGASFGIVSSPQPRIAIADLVPSQEVQSRVLNTWYLTDGPPDFSRNGPSVKRRRSSTPSTPVGPSNTQQVGAGSVAAAASAPSADPFMDALMQLKADIAKEKEARKALRRKIHQALLDS